MYVGPGVQSKWIKELSKTAPTLAFHASITNPFGKVRRVFGVRAGAPGGHMLTAAAFVLAPCFHCTRVRAR